jgi:hypothetical protein
MDIRFVTQRIHSYLDYPVAFALMGLPFLLQLGQSHPAALWLSVVTGIAAFVLTLVADHETGVFRIVPYSAHVAVDGAVGISFALAPFVLGFTGLDAWFYWLNGAAVLTVIALSRPEQDKAVAA